MAPMVLVLFGLSGWAALEPADAERVPRTVLALSVPFACVWIRAMLRAGNGLKRRPEIRAAGVVGLWNPRILISDQFRAAVDERAVAAAAAHEAAHVRHRDPMRLWLAQLATDLQWPSPRAAKRLGAWIRVLEFARDDEAREDGIDGADLAAAILVAVRLHDADRFAAALVGERTNFETRIRRLLAPLPSDEAPPLPPVNLLALAVAPALIAIAVAGALSGETLVRAVFNALP